MLKKYRDDLKNVNLLPPAEEIYKRLPVINFEDKVIFKKTDDQPH
jgi:hypothetical protein